MTRNELFKLIEAVDRSIVSAVQDDPPADWRESLEDARDALEAIKQSECQGIALMEGGQS